MPVQHGQKRLHTLINDLCCSPALKLSCPSVFITVFVSNKQPTKELRKHTRLISPSRRIFRKTSSLVRKQIQTKTTLKSFVFFHFNFFLMPLHQLMRATDLDNHMTPDTFATFKRSSSWGLNKRGKPLSRVESWQRRDNLFSIMFRMRSLTRFTRGEYYFRQHSGLDDFTRVGYCQVLHPKINYLQQSTSEMTANPENIPNDPHLFPYFETCFRCFSVRPVS